MENKKPWAAACHRGKLSLWVHIYGREDSYCTCVFETRRWLPPWHTDAPAVSLMPLQLDSPPHSESHLMDSTQLGYCSFKHTENQERFDFRSGFVGNRHSWCECCWHSLCPMCPESFLSTAVLDRSNHIEVNTFEWNIPCCFFWCSLTFLDQSVFHYSPVNELHQPAVVTGHSILSDCCFTQGSMEFMDTCAPSLHHVPAFTLNQKTLVSYSEGTCLTGRGSFTISWERINVKWKTFMSKCADLMFL